MSFVPQLFAPGGLRRALYCALTAILLGSDLALATNIRNVQPAALDQPRINAILRYPAAGGTMTNPLSYEIFGDRYFNIQAFYDTGASGVLLSPATADYLGIPDNAGVTRSTYNGQPVVFEDVGVAGSDQFNVSVPLHVSIGRFHPDADELIANAESEYSYDGTLSTLNQVYTHTFGPIRTQIGPLVSNPDPNLEGLDVFGMPLMRNKVVVMDPKPVDTMLDTMRTYVYNPGTAFNAAKADSDPGIPQTTRTVKLSAASFAAFTKVTPTGAPGPTLSDNPFIGPNPVTKSPTDTTPPVKITYGAASATGSFLLDTGAAASMISTAMALKLGLTVNDSNPDAPYIVGMPLSEQFTMTVGGIGGTKTAPGFYLSSMLLKTAEGNVADENDYHHLRFLDAPVLIADITVKNPTTNQTLTLDGIFGMNYLVSSAFLAAGSGGIPSFDVVPGAFDWVVYDEPSKTLKLRPRIPGDVNRDGIVNFDDLLVLSQNYNKTSSGSEPWLTADFNGDGITNFDDLLALAQHYNGTDVIAGDEILLPFLDLPTGAAALPGLSVPEPAIGGMLVLAGTMMLMRRGKKS